jgi:hypothetical protein
MGSSLSFITDQKAGEASEYSTTKVKIAYISGTLRSYLESLQR